MSAADGSTGGLMSCVRHKIPPPMALALVIYGALALLANWPTWPGDPASIRPGDLSLDTWMLAWTPHALLHGENAFATNFVNYPVGVNLAQNTSMPLLGLLTAPLTLLVSPVASLNLLLWLAPTLSAAAMFFVLRRVVTSELAAFAGGLLYGFSPYIVSQQVNHLNLAFVPLPPLILYYAFEVFRTGQRRAGLLLGLCMTAQVYVTSEIAVTTAIIGFVATIVFGLQRPWEILPTLRRAVPALTIGAGVALVLSIPYIFEITHGAYMSPGEVPWIGGRQADLLTPILPTDLQRFGPTSWKAVGDTLVQGALSENDAYLGIPLLLLLAGFTVVFRRRRGMVPAFVMVLVSLVLSLGTYLKVDDRLSTIALPDVVALHAPLLQEIIPVRLALFAFLFASVVVALGIDALHSNTPRSISRVAFGALGTVTIISLIPAWPAPTFPIGVPAYFTSDATQRIPYGAVVLMTPYASSLEPGASLFQAEAQFRFRMLGGYGMFRDAAGYPDTNPAHLQPFDVIQYITAMDTGGTMFVTGPIPTLNHRLVCDARSFLRANSVDVVLSSDVGVSPTDDQRLFTDALGPASSTTGDVAAWYDVRAALRADPPKAVDCP